MKKSIHLTMACAVLAICGAAQAVDFQTAAGSKFTHSFLLTPTNNNSLVLSVSGFDAQYSALSFDILSGPSIVASLQGGNLVAAFNDPRNRTFNLTGGTTYTLNIRGTTKAAPVGTFGVVSVTAINGTVSPVPEPETFAMLLAGLGLMGTIARRRNKVAAAS